MEAAQQIEVMTRAKYPILYVVSWEERRVEEAVRSVCEKLKRDMHTWSATLGLQPPLRPSQREGKQPGDIEVLAQIYSAPEFNLFLLKDFHPYLKDPRTVRLLRDLAARLRGRSQTVVLVSPALNLPSELEKDIAVVEFPLPRAADIEAKLEEVIRDLSGDEKVDTSLTPEQRELIVKSAQGLTMDEIEAAFARSVVEVRRLDVERILEEKKQIVRKSGLLEYYPATDRMEDVGGHELLKEWLIKRRECFTDRAKEFGIPAPKGILLLGVQGCGKSLVAKTVAAAWNLPMLKLDVGRIFGSLVGQSEQNIRRAISVAESVAPCILWADELEKGFAGVGSSGVSDSGTTARVFATFLSWMQDKTKPVFMIATANDVSALPPELLRKGRFDEIFFIDLPIESERMEIFRIHLRKRKRDPAKFRLKELAKATAGFSGAEIEQVVIGGLTHAFSEGREMKQADLIEESKAQVPLSVMMREEIDELRTWAQMRARPSSKRASGVKV